MKKIILLIFILIPTCHVYCATTSSITQYGITWTFSEATTYGQFANGDYYVVEPSLGSGVLITGIENNFHAVDLSTVDYDGSDVDCDWTSADVTPDQGLDSRHTSGGNAYDSGLNVNKNLPHTLNAGESLLTAVSWQSGDSGIPVDALDGLPYLKRIAILTCLSTDVGSTAFRPSYAAGQKTIYYTTRLRTSFLPLLASPSSVDQETTATYQAWTQGPWTDLNKEYTSQSMRPTDNYVSGTGASPSYNRYVVNKYGEALLGLTLDPSESGDRTNLLINLVQIGIDYYGLLQNGATWPPNGGHQHGYKLPILFAGFMLNDYGMLSIGTNESYAVGTQTFQDDSYWYITEADWYPTRTVCGDKYEGVNNYTAGCSDCITFQESYQYNSIDHPDGTAEWGISHWGTYSCKDDSRLDAGYRPINARPLMGHALSALIFNLRSEWSNNAFFDYHDRWDTWSGTFDSEFVEDMWDTYRGGAPYVNSTQATIQEGPPVTITTGTTVNVQ